MDVPTWEARRRSFGAAAARYDRVRPGYPPAALHWILGDRRPGPDAPPAPGVGLRVLDLGAGTGILSRQLADLGHQVIAVEPDAAMRALTGGRTAVGGTAEALPFADSCVDAVLAGQAYHWFDTARAHPEIARVLRPGGVFAPLWNLRDESVPWVAELSRIARQMGDRVVDIASRAELDFGPRFSAVQRATFRCPTTHTAESLLELVRSWSHYLTASPPVQSAVEDTIRELAATHPDLTGRAEFELPYLTVAYRAYPLPS